MRLDDARIIRTMAVNSLTIYWWDGRDWSENHGDALLMEVGSKTAIENMTRAQSAMTPTKAEGAVFAYTNGSKA